MPFLNYFKLFKVTTEITAQTIVFQDIIIISSLGNIAFVAHYSHSDYILFKKYLKYFIRGITLVGEKIEDSD